MTITEAARILKRNAVTIGTVVRRKYHTRLEIVEGLSTAGHNQVRLIPEDALLDLMEQYRSPRLLDFVSAIEQYQAFITE